MKGWTSIMSTSIQELAPQNGNTAAIAENQQVTIDLALKVRNAAELGWAMTELLGRCFLIESGYHRPPDQPEFSVDYPVILSPVLDPLERICNVTGRILFLAKELQIDECKIKHKAIENAIKHIIVKNPEELQEAMKEIRESIQYEIERKSKSASDSDAHKHIPGLKNLLHLLTPQTLQFPDLSIDETEEICISDKLLGDLVQKLLSKLATGTVSDPKDTTHRNLFIAINIFLFYWGESIQIALQDRPPVVYNAYTVGRGFATIRWYIGIGNTAKGKKLALENNFHWYIRWCTGFGNAKKTPDEVGNKREDRLVTADALNKLRDHLHSMSCYLPPFVANALDYSLDMWGQAIIDNRDNLNMAIKKDQQEKIAQNKGEQPPTDGQGNKKPSKARQKSYERMRIALIKQSIIWHDLLSGDRDPTSYVNPHAISWHFTRWLLIIGAGFLVIGVIVFAAIFFAVTHIQNLVLQQPLTKPTAGTPQSITDTIITALATIPLIRTLWFWAARTTTKFTTAFMAKKGDAVYGEVSTSGKDSLHLLWQRAQQVAINKATYRSPKPALFFRVFPFLLRIPKKDGEGDDGD